MSLTFFGISRLTLRGSILHCSAYINYSPVYSPERMQVGFITLRGLVAQRPALRTDALQILLEMTTHPGLFWHSVSACLFAH